MPSIYRSALVPYSAADMYQLVCDIESYPLFLPWCDDARIEEQSVSHQVASVAISKRFSQARFKTRNELVANEQICMSLVDGPFERLDGTWRFTALNSTACKIELDVDFQFANTLVAGLISPVFTQICDSLVSAFTQRATRVLGTGGDT